MRLDINTIKTRLDRIEDTLHQLRGNEEHLFYFCCVIITFYVELILIVSYI